MALEELRLTKNPSAQTAPDGDQRSYDIYPIQSVDIRSRKEALSIAPPGLAARDNILLGVSGMQATITITASIWDDGTDRANGSHSSTVITVEDQLTYLEDVMHDPDFSVGWQLGHLTGNAFANDEVYVESIEPTALSVDSPKWKPVRLSLRRGGSI